MLLSHKLTISQLMTDIIFHKSNKYIDDDIHYYASDTRDKHGAVKPSKNIKSYTLDSDSFDNNAKLPSLYYPFQKHSIDRVYLGISFPLYANNWGAEFLRYLMYVIKRDGAVIFPVYAERQGVEKNYWSRSILEVAFQSRQKWWGMSNIWAENDGVMSMRIGKKEPKVRNSTFTYFIDKTLPKLYQENKLDELQNEIDNQNENLRLSAVVEKIILDNHGRNKKINLAVVSDNTLLGMELACSDYMNIKSTKVYSGTNNNIDAKQEYLPKQISDYYNHVATTLNEDFFVSKHNVVLIDQKYFNQELSDHIIANALNNLDKDGFIILVNRHLENNYKSSDYSHTVGTKLKDGYDIPHYSDLIFEELKTENTNRDSAVKVIHKKDNA
jgi:hypothetical protein